MNIDNQTYEYYNLMWVKYFEFLTKNVVRLEAEKFKARTHAQNTYTYAGTRKTQTYTNTHTDTTCKHKTNTKHTYLHTNAYKHLQIHE